MNELCCQGLTWVLAFALACPLQDTVNTSPNNNEVPFELIGGFVIEFAGSVGGLEGLRFILDTGANCSVVDRRITERLRIRLHPTKLFDFDRTTIVSEGTFPEVRFGPVILKNVTLRTTELHKLSSFAKGADAIIGTDLLSLVNLAADYDQNKLFFWPPEQSVSSAKSHGLGLIVQLRIQEQPIEVLLDTGIERLVLFKERLERDVPHLLIGKEEKRVVIGLETQATEVALPGIYLGAEEINAKVLLVKGPEARVLPGIDGYLGVSALNAHRVEFDISGNRLRWR